MHPENAIDNGDFIKILVYKFILRCESPDMCHSMFATARRCLALDYAGNRGRADSSGSGRLHYE